MPSNNNRPVKIPSGGFVSELALRIKLIMRLMGDNRVSPLLKLLPVGTLLYLIIPDIIIGPLDDAAVVGLGMTLFVELCPQYVVDEHMRTLRVYKPPAGGDKTNNPPHHEEEVLEGVFHDADESSPRSQDGQEQESREQ